MSIRGVWSRHRGLVVVNAVLVVALAGVAAVPSALAQRAAARQRGDYTMVSGQILGSEEHGLYIVDAANQEMVCLQFDRSRQAMRFVGYRDLAADVRAASTRSR
jgi:predicted ThiF/HesA family dinucleotide-utilizing enzyme